jgi:hypothetical protein
MVEKPHQKTREHMRAVRAEMQADDLIYLCNCGE